MLARWNLSETRLQVSACVCEVRVSSRRLQGPMWATAPLASTGQQHPSLSRAWMTASSLTVHRCFTINIRNNRCSNSRGRSVGVSVCHVCHETTDARTREVGRSVCLCVMCVMKQQMLELERSVGVSVCHGVCVSVSACSSCQSLLHVINVKTQFIDMLP